MAIKYNRKSTNKDYNNLLKDLGIIKTDNEKKNIRWTFKTKMMLQNKWQMVTQENIDYFKSKMKKNDIII